MVDRILSPIRDYIKSTIRSIQSALAIRLDIRFGDDVHSTHWQMAGSDWLVLQLCLPSGKAAGKWAIIGRGLPPG